MGYSYDDHFIRDLIERKRQDPQDDILTALIQAEENGEKLSEDELVSMVLLLIVAGYETTVHLITNSIVALLEHPDQLARLREQPELMESAVEEVLRYLSPIQSTKPMYPTEDITFYGRTIPRGATVMPLLGAANHDPAMFEILKSSISPARRTVISALDRVSIIVSVHR